MDNLAVDVLATVAVLANASHEVAFARGRFEFQVRVAFALNIAVSVGESALINHNYFLVKRTISMQFPVFAQFSFLFLRKVLAHAEEARALQAKQLSVFLALEV